MLLCIRSLSGVNGSSQGIAAIRRFLKLFQPNWAKFLEDEFFCLENSGSFENWESLNAGKRLE